MPTTTTLGCFIMFFNTAQTFSVDMAESDDASIHHQLFPKGKSERKDRVRNLLHNNQFSFQQHFSSTSKPHTTTTVETNDAQRKE
mmetsp:Transcript_23629/g.65717  ORF Transcript_23629/g.65717 Transcript_23629/m.65717 type:complete len:85 (+) Transcript_23629:402-656(+)